MKTNIKILVCVLLTALLATSSLSAKGKKGEESWRYDIECAGIGSEGSYLIKVWSYGKNAKMATETMKKNAVHGVIFRGFAGGQGCTAQKPLARTPAVYQEKEEFFNAFFGDEGTYLKYSSVVSPSPEIIKVNKKEYKVGIVVSVSKDLLRKDLEAAGIIKSLSAGF